MGRELGTPSGYEALMLYNAVLHCIQTSDMLNCNGTLIQVGIQSQKLRQSIWPELTT